MEANIPFVSRQDILNFPFPYKLWLAVNLEYCDFLLWNRDGTVILLDLVALETYLNSTRSIFKIKNSSSFLRHLEEFQFQRLNSTPEADEDLLLQYKNDNFQRHRLDLLAKIRRHTYQLLGQFPTQNTDECQENLTKSKTHCHNTSIPKRVSERMLGDLCFMFHGGISKIKKSRLRFKTILHFNNEKRILKNKLEASESAHNILKSKLEISFRSAPGTSSSEEDQVIELPVELFENPHDSVLNLGEEFLPAYAGYYGNCSTDQIMHFFGEYLPMYEDGSLEVKKIETDISAGSANKSLLSNTETNTMQYYSSNADGQSNAITSTPVPQDAMYNFNFSSNLEPIFITNENTENINSNYNNSTDFTVTYLTSNASVNNGSVLDSNKLNDEDDISMEEFITFKNFKSENLSSSSCQLLNDIDKENYNSYSQEQECSKAFPQMPASFQMKLNDDIHENEANFRNFFSQYRASLNLLYDR